MSVCLSPAAAAQVDPLVAVQALVRSQWQTFDLPRAVVVTQPQGQTLVGAVTRFSSAILPRISLPPRDILGYSVTLTITATRYVWDFGDGTTLPVAVGGGLPAAEHVYRTAGAKSVTLRAYYTAVFTIAGSAQVYPLDGTADVPGTPALVTARQARSQLEAGTTGP